MNWPFTKKEKDKKTGPTDASDRSGVNNSPPVGSVAANDNAHGGSGGSPGGQRSGGPDVPKPNGQPSGPGSSNDRFPNQPSSGPHNPGGTGDNASSRQPDQPSGPGSSNDRAPTKPNKSSGPGSSGDRLSSTRPGIGGSQPNDSEHGSSSDRLTSTVPGSGGTGIPASTHGATGGFFEEGLFDQPKQPRAGHIFPPAGSSGGSAGSTTESGNVATNSADKPYRIIPETPNNKPDLPTGVVIGNDGLPTMAPGAMPAQAASTHGARGFDRANELDLGMPIPKATLASSSSDGAMREFSDLSSTSAADKPKPKNPQKWEPIGKDKNGNEIWVDFDNDGKGGGPRTKTVSPDGTVKIYEGTYVHGDPIATYTENPRSDSPAIPAGSPKAEAPASNASPSTPEPPKPYTAGAGGKDWASTHSERLKDGSTRTITESGAVIRKAPGGNSYREGWVDPASGYDMSTLKPGAKNPYSQPSRELTALSSEPKSGKGIDLTFSPGVTDFPKIKPVPKPNLDSAPVSESEKPRITVDNSPSGSDKAPNNKPDLPTGVVIGNDGLPTMAPGAMPAQAASTHGARGFDRANELDLGMLPEPPQAPEPVSEPVPASYEPTGATNPVETPAPNPGDFNPIANLGADTSAAANEDVLLGNQLRFQ